jgi:hypothetical protein
MIRVVLVGWEQGDWRTYRQPQWIGEVRRDPAASGRPRLHFDIDEDAYKACLAEWGRSGAGASREAALAALARHGAAEVARG